MDKEKDIVSMLLKGIPDGVSLQEIQDYILAITDLIGLRFVDKNSVELAFPTMMSVGILIRQGIYIKGKRCIIIPGFQLGWTFRNKVARSANTIQFKIDTRLVNIDLMKESLNSLFRIKLVISKTEELPDNQFLISFDCPPNIDCGQFFDVLGYGGHYYDLPFSNIDFDMISYSKLLFAIESTFMNLVRRALQHKDQLEDRPLHYSCCDRNRKCNFNRLQVSDNDALDFFSTDNNNTFFREFEEVITQAKKDCVIEKCLLQWEEAQQTCATAYQLNELKARNPDSTSTMQILLSFLQRSRNQSKRVVALQQKEVVISTLEINIEKASRRLGEKIDFRDLSPSEIKAKKEELRKARKREKFKIFKKRKRKRMQDTTNDVGV